MNASRAAFTLVSLLYCAAPITLHAESMAAQAGLKPTKGHTAEGDIRFEKGANQVKLTGTIKGLTPGKHGFHVHEKGDCSAPDGSSAGDHYNPTGDQHGAPTAARRHIGDLGNIVADPSGVAQIEMTYDHLPLEGMDSVIGRALVVHADPDDLSTQPSGKSGARVACGVIKKAG
jgi:superoxide dismutase, Cu-Zn family